MAKITSVFPRILGPEASEIYSFRTPEKLPSFKKGKDRRSSVNLRARIRMVKDDCRLVFNDFLVALGNKKRDRERGFV